MKYPTQQRRLYGLTALVTFVWSMFLSPLCAMGATTTLRAGTVVTCEFSDPVYPATATIGRRLTLTVSEPVTIQGVTVIERGAPAQAEVVQSQKKGALGKPAMISVRLVSVTAVDSTVVGVTGYMSVEGANKQSTSVLVTILCCVLGLLIEGGPAWIPVGTQVDAKVVSDAQITT